MNSVSKEKLCSVLHPEMEEESFPEIGNFAGEAFEFHSGNAPLRIFPGNGENSSFERILFIPDGKRGALRIEIAVRTENTEKSDSEDVYRVHLSQKAEKQNSVLGTPVRTKVPPLSEAVRKIELESCYPVPEDAFELNVRVERLSADRSDTYTSAAELLEIRVFPLKTPPSPLIVQNIPGYNSWPMIQADGQNLISAYSRGTAHDIGEGCRGVYARTSRDGGKTWSPEVVISNNPEFGEVTIGKGLDETGAVLFWIRSCHGELHHDLYRTADGGKTFTRIATPPLDPVPMQITDIFAVPGTGLMALWFAGNYHDDALNAWGTLVSPDNGKTWEQHVMERGIPKAEWPTEPSAVYLGNGRIFAIARTECVEESTRAAQFQLESTDSGKTWTRFRTNIGDVSISTPCLILDRTTGLLSNYHFQRGRGLLKRRVVEIAKIIGHPLDWPNPEVVAIASTSYLDAGNVNVSAIGSTHYVNYYSGKAPNTAIVVSPVPAPDATEVCREKNSKSSIL